MRTHTNRITTEEFVYPLRKEFMDPACRVDMVSPNGPVPHSDVLLFETVFGRRLEDKIEEIER